MTVRIPSARARRQINSAGKIERGGRRDVRKGDDLRARGDALPEAIYKFLGRGDRQRNRVVDVFHPTLVKVEMPGVVDGAIFVVGGEDFVARLEV